MTFISLLGTGKKLTTAFSPVSLGSMRGWYTGDDGITLNGATVSQRNNLTGTGEHLKQASVTSQPQLIANSLNGHAVLRYDGSNDFLGLDASMTGFENMTFFTVIKRATNTSQAILSNGASTYMYLQYGSSFLIGNNSKSAAMTNDVWYVRAGKGKSDGTGTAYFSNGVSLGTVAGGTNVFNAFRYIGSAAGAYFNGWEAETWLFDEFLSDAAIIEGSNQLKSKYGI